jgi:hypothetical protein
MMARKQTLELYESVLKTGSDPLKLQVMKNIRVSSEWRACYFILAGARLKYSSRQKYLTEEQVRLVQAEKVRKEAAETSE